MIFYTINETSIRSYAKTKDITYSISSQDKNNVKKLTKCFSTPCGYDLTERMIQGEETGYKFSNASERRHILNLNYDKIYETGKDIFSKRLFGVETSNITPKIGQWGTSYPVIKVKSIYKSSTGKYKINTNLVWHNSEYETNTKVGEVDFIIKKKPNSYYGYVVKSLKIIKTSNF